MTTGTHAGHGTPPIVAGYTVMAAIRATILSCLINVGLAALCCYHGTKAVANLPSDDSVARLATCILFGGASLLGICRTFIAYRHPLVSLQEADHTSRKER